MPTSRLRTAIKSTDAVCSELAELGRMAGDAGLLGRRARQVSAWSIGEQIEHLRRSDITILAALDNVDAATPRAGSPSFIGRVVLLTGFIPRGKGKAPTATQPLEVDQETLTSDLDALRARFEDLRPRLAELAALDGTIRHPALGHFTASQMLAFAGIHHRHHRKIIRDINRAAEE